MRSLFLIYRAQFRTNVAVQLQYRVALLIWLIGIVLEPVVFLVVWSTVAQTGGGVVGGFTAREFAAYFISMMVIDHLTFTWHMWEYDFRIREGLLSPMLLRPLHPIHADVADNLAYKIITLSVMIPSAIVLVILFRPVFNTPLWALLGLIPALVLSFSLRFLTGWAVAMSAFWTTRIIAINEMFFVAELFFSGRLAPLSLLPQPLQAVSWTLPFRWGLGFPVELALGRLSPREMILGLGVQATWVIVSLLLVRVVWRAGMRRYAAFGA